MRRTNADCYTHEHGHPLRALNGPRDQLLFEDFGLTYRERLQAVEAEILRRRRMRLDDCR